MQRNGIYFWEYTLSVRRCRALLCLFSRHVKCVTALAAPKAQNTFLMFKMLVPISGDLFHWHFWISPKICFQFWSLINLQYNLFLQIILLQHYVETQFFSMCVMSHWIIRPTHLFFCNSEQQTTHPLLFVQSVSRTSFTNMVGLVTKFTQFF